MRFRNGPGRTVLLLGLVFVILAACLLVFSCGSKSTGTSSATGSSTTTVEDVDVYVVEMDRAIKSVNENDWNESQLSDNALGL